jgi:hypothetical protein
LKPDRCVASDQIDSYLEPDGRSGITFPSRVVTVPVEGDAGAVEGHHHQDPPQGHRELDLCDAPPHPYRRLLPVSPRSPSVLARPAAFRPPHADLVESGAAPAGRGSS